MSMSGPGMASRDLAESRCSGRRPPAPRPRLPLPPPAALGRPPRGRPLRMLRLVPAPHGERAAAARLSATSALPPPSSRRLSPCAVVRRAIRLAPAAVRQASSSRRKSRRGILKALRGPTHLRLNRPTTGSRTWTRRRTEATTPLATGSRSLPPRALRREPRDPRRLTARTRGATPSCARGAPRPRKCWLGRRRRMAGALLVGPQGTPIARAGVTTPTASSRS
mmetsp:Transcript_58186/g.131507  ORF Transcript_58186/g.131507 Transcript_58186/m.131507 type:complete len:223 (+) Transcript_58186:178-846(+)